MDFYEIAPFDDFHRFHRPAALIAQRMAGGEIQPLLDFLRPPLNDEQYSSADLSFLKAFNIKLPGT
jgi:hypothetical protein